MTYPLAYTGASGIAAVDTQFPSGQPLPQVSLDDVKENLRQGSATVNDSMLSDYLDAALTRIADICIPLGPTTVVDSFDGSPGAGTLVLSTFPVTAVSSVTVYDGAGVATSVLPAGGATGVADGYRANLSAGTIRRIGYRTWPTGWGNIAVTYTAGPAVTPPDAWLAVILTVQEWWESRRLSGNLRAPGGTNGDPGDLPEPMSGIPVGAYDLLLNYLKPGRVA